MKSASTSWLGGAAALTLVGGAVWWSARHSPAPTDRRLEDHLQDAAARDVASAPAPEAPSPAPPLGCPQAQPLGVIALPGAGVDALLRFGGGPNAQAGSAACGQGVGLRVEAASTDAAWVEALARGARGAADGAVLGVVPAERAAALLTQANLEVGAIIRDPAARPQVVVLGLLAESAGDEALVGPATWATQPALARGVGVSTRPDGPGWLAARQWALDHGLDVAGEGSAEAADAVHRVDAADDASARAALDEGRCVESPSSQAGKSRGVCIEAFAGPMDEVRRALAHNPELVVLTTTSAYQGLSATWLVGVRRAIEARPDDITALLSFALTLERRPAEPAATRALWLAQLYPSVSVDAWATRLAGTRAATLVDNLDAFERWTGADGRAFAIWRLSSVSRRPGALSLLSLVDARALEALRTAAPPAPPTLASWDAAASRPVRGGFDFALEFKPGAVMPTPAGELALSTLRDRLVLSPGAEFTLTAFGDGLEPSRPPGTPDADVPDPEAPTVGTLAEERAGYVVTWLQDHTPRVFAPGRLRAVGSQSQGEGLRVDWARASERP